MPEPSTLFFVILFSAIGLAAFYHGRRNTNYFALLLGIALMVFPYFIEGLLPTIAIGAGLTAATWFTWS